MKANTRITRAEIEIDDNPENPMNWDNAATIVAIGRRIYIKGAETANSMEAFEEMMSQRPEYEDDEPIADDADDKIIAYDYVSTQSGDIGAYITHGKAKKEWGENYTLEMVKHVITGELETMHAWAEGEVYGYTLFGVEETTAEDGTIAEGDEEIIDSCWGYYGDHKESGIMDNIPAGTEIEYR